MTIHHDSDAHRPEDWHTQALEAHARRERQLCSSPLSAAWSRRHGKEAALDLRRIRDNVYNLLRIAGLPKSCRVELAGSSLRAAAAAGFEDAPASFDCPYILLDKHPYETCPLDEVQDVYLGLGLHEAGHVLHTRDGYRRLMAGGLSRVRRHYDNLLEDERIEELIRRDAPGFAPYFQVTKRALLERQELGQALAGWDALPDLDKVRALIFAFIRCPYLLSAAMQEWTAVNGECVFATLRALFPDGPVTEADVDRGAGLLEQIW
jgi:hypothetical protein